MTTTVFIVDDHELMREGLKSVLAGRSDVKVIGEAGSFAEMTEKFEKALPDVVVLDISLPDRNGLDVLKYIRNVHPKVRVLILSMHPEERFALRAMKAGASGYINKQTAAQELIQAIDTVRAHGKYVSSPTAEVLLEEIGRKNRKPDKKLTDREFEVLRLIGMGMSVAEVAKELSLSVNTIVTYRTRILEKLNVRTTAALVRYAVQKKLVD